MTTTKFSPGDRVRVYDRDLFKGGKCNARGAVAGQQSDDWVLVVFDDSTGHTRGFHPKQLRRLVKRKRVVWESEFPIRESKDWKGRAMLQDGDAARYGDLFDQFIGKRVRIVITEAKEKP